MMKRASIICCLLIGFSLHAQVGINTTTPNLSTVLDVSASNKGVLLPRVSLSNVTQTTLDGLHTAATGLLIYNTNAGVTGGNGTGYYLFNGTTWEKLVSTNKSFWSTTGNSSTDPTTDFIGTTDNVDLVFKRNNIWYGSLNNLNLSLGAYTHSLVTTGIANTVFGSYAQRNLTSGSYNTGIGYHANYAVTTGSQNTAIGDYANYQNQTADNNTAIGARALYYSTTGDRNVAVGVVASYKNTSGSSNVAIGDAALQENETGSYNVSIGRYSALYHETSNNNVFIGGLSAFGPNNSNSSSSNNVMVGYASGYNSGSVSGNIFIGYQSGYSETGNNKLYVENSYSSQPLIYGEFDNNILKINGEFQVNNPSTTNNEAVIKNNNNYDHSSGIQNFGTSGGNDFLLASRENVWETGGIRGDGDHVTIWSPADGNRLVRFLDEDFWGDGNSNPYDNNAERAYIDPAGQYFQVSDERSKTHVKRIESATATLLQINGYTYDFKQTSEDISKGNPVIHASGFLAQELQQHIPEAVNVNEEGDYHVNYQAMVPYLLEAFKEINGRLEAQEQELIQLRALLLKKQ